MKRNFIEDQMNELYNSVQDGNLDCFYALEEYLSDRGYRDGFYGIDTEEDLDNVYVDDTDVIYD